MVQIRNKEVSFRGFIKSRGHGRQVLVVFTEEGTKGSFKKRLGKPEAR